jgi:hypothetical protein
MPLKRAGAAPRTIAEPEVPDEIPRHGRNSRPWIRKPGLEWEATDPQPGRGDYYARASGFAKCIEDTYRINRARERRIVHGMSRHRELVMRAAAVRSQDAREDKGELEAIADKACEFARGDAATTKGTAFHKLREQLDAGHDLSHLDPLTVAGLDAWTRLLSRFRIVASETFVVNDELKAAGTFDALLEVTEPIVIHRHGKVLGRPEPGEHIIGDLKSGQWGREWWGPTYAVQALIYATGQPYTHRGGRAPWPGGDPSPRWAAIPHVPVDEPERAELCWVDLDAARLRLEVVEAIQWARRGDDLFIADEPYLAEHILPSDMARAGLLALINEAKTRAALRELWANPALPWDDLVRQAAVDAAAALPDGV